MPKINTREGSRQRVLRCSTSYAHAVVGRFTSQALLGEKALLACKAYVDLNLIRAKMADTPEQTDHTSIQTRTHAIQKQQSLPATLAPYTGAFSGSNPDLQGIPFELSDYLSLIDWTGKAIRQDKRGFINHDLPPILARLYVTTELWLQLAKDFGEKTSGLTGSYNKTKIAATVHGSERAPNVAQNK